MKRHQAIATFCSLICIGAVGVGFAEPEAQTPMVNMSAEQVVKQLTERLMKDLQADPDLRKGDARKIRATLDREAMTYIDMPRMTAATLGQDRWNKLPSAKQNDLTEQFFQLLIVQYAGHLYRIDGPPKDFEVVPSAHKDSAELIAYFKTKDGNTRVRFKLLLVDGAWKIVNLSVLDVWVVETFRTQFEIALRRGGIDGLIAELAAKNRNRAASK